MCTRSVPEARPAPPHPSFPRNRLCQKVNFEARKANPVIPVPLRHSRESGNPGVVVEGCYSGVSPLHPAWIPAFAGMTISGVVCLSRMAF